MAIAIVRKSFDEKKIKEIEKDETEYTREEWLLVNTNKQFRMKIKEFIKEHKDA